MAKDEQLNPAHILIPGSSDNCEDEIVMMDDKRIYGVIDGVTSIDGSLDKDGRTGGYLAAQVIKSRIQAMHAEETLEEAIRSANRELRKAMLGAGVPLEAKERLWSAAFAVFRVHDSSIEYAQAGDCMIGVIYDDGSVRVLTRDHVARYDRRTMELVRQVRAVRGGAGFGEIRHALLPLLLENRQHANTLGGYSVMNGEEAFEAFFEFGRINRTGIQAIYCATDGLFPLAGDGKAADMEAMFRDMNQAGLAAYAENLIELEESDPACLAYPRFKKSDDKAGIQFMVQPKTED